MSYVIHVLLFFFFFNDTATTEIYTLSLHDALPICRAPGQGLEGRQGPAQRGVRRGDKAGQGVRQGPQGPGYRRDALPGRSEEHTSELQSRQYLVCRLLLEKKK